jgi:twitching motility protein PilT
MEILVVDSGVSNMIREGKTFQIPSAMETGGRKGMMPLNKRLMELIKANEVEIPEAYMKSIDKISFKQNLEDAGYKLNMNT